MTSSSGQGTSTPETALRGYRFAGFTLDVSRRRLAGPGDIPIALSGRAFEVLVLLLAHRDRLVTKRELLDGVWPRMVVEENNLTQAISTLRRVLGDSRESPQFIATVAGRGYQFIGEVSPWSGEQLAAETLAQSGARSPGFGEAPDVQPPAAPPDANGAPVPVAMPAPASMTRRNVLLGAGVGVAALVAGVGGWWLSQRPARLPSTIAVLPFRPLLATARNEAIEIGVAELLINRLSMLPGIVVRPLSSVRRYGSMEQDPLAAGRALGVEAVVEGYVQIEQTDVRVTVRLLDVETGQSLWAGNYTEKLGDFFVVQDSLVTQLVAALPVELPERARQRLVAYSTRDSEAWQLYAQGRYQIERRDQGSIRRAREFFEAAIARDPEFALAVTGLSEAWALSGTFALVPPREAFTQARAAAERALAIDPRLPPALVALGHVRTQLDHAWQDARRLYQQALALEPKAAWTHSFLALNHVQSGSLSVALEHIGRAQALEPASVPFMAIGGFARYFNREFEAARNQLARVLASVPQAALARQFLARTLLILDDAPAVIQLLEEAKNPPAPGSYSNLGRAYARVGRIDDAWLQVAAARAAEAQGFGAAYDLALMYLALGDEPRALDALERAVDDGSQMIGYINVDAALDAIRDEPRVRAVAKRIGLA